MPLLLNEVLFKNDDRKKQIMIDDFLAILNDGEAYFNGAFKRNEFGITVVSFKIIDELSNDIVLKCLFTLKENKGLNEIIDIDIIIPNEKIEEIEFIRRDDNGDEYVNGYWYAQKDMRNILLSTANCLLLKYQIKGKQKISLSAFLKDEYIMAENMDLLNQKLQDYNNNHNDKFVGFAQDFVGIDMIIGKILSHRKIKTIIGRNYYEFLIVNIETYFGNIPILFPIEEENNIIDNYYGFFKVYFKADFSCDYYNYYLDRKKEN